MPRCPIVTFGVVFLSSVWSKKRTTSHTCVCITVFQLPFNFVGNIIWNHTFCCASSRQLSQIVIFRTNISVILIQSIYQFRKCWCYPCPCFIFHPFHSLFQNFFYNNCQIRLFPLILSLVNIHINCNERSLSVGSHQCYYLILYGLNAFLDIFIYQMLNELVIIVFGHKRQQLAVLLSEPLSRIVHKWSEMRKTD